VDREGAEVTSAGRSFQTRAPATEKAWLPTVGSLTAGTLQLLIAFSSYCWLNMLYRVGFWQAEPISAKHG